MTLNTQELALQIDKLDISVRDKEIVKFRYGLTGLPHTFEEVGKVFGVTRQRVQQIEKRVEMKIAEGRKLRTIE